MVPFEPNHHDVRVERNGWAYWVRGVRRSEQFLGDDTLLGPGIADAVAGLVISMVHGAFAERFRWKVGVVRVPDPSTFNSGGARVVHKEFLAIGTEPEPRIAQLVADIHAGRFDDVSSSG